MNRKLDFSNTALDSLFDSRENSPVKETSIARKVFEDNETRVIPDRTDPPIFSPIKLRTSTPLKDSSVPADNAPTPEATVSGAGAPAAAVEPAPKAKYCKDYCLGASFLPIIGTIPSIASQCVLSKKLSKETESDKMTALLTRINQYKVASIVRTVLTLAAVIAFLAFGILTGGLALGVGLGLVAGSSFIGLGLIAFHAIQLHTNKTEIKSLADQPKNPPEPTATT